MHAVRCIQADRQIADPHIGQWAVNPTRGVLADKVSCYTGALVGVAPCGVKRRCATDQCAERENGRLTGSAQRDRVRRRSRYIKWIRCASAAWETHNQPP